MTAILDIECAGWDRFVLGALWIDGDFFVTRDSDELIDRLLSYEGEVWAHNGGRYDWLWALDELSRVHGTKARIFMSGSSATRIDLGKTVLRDSMRLVPMGLPKLAAIGGVEVEKDTGLPCVCDDDCGGYCSIALDMPESYWSTLTEYLEQDCIGTAAGLDTLQYYAESHGIVLKGTVGGSAWATAKAWLGLPDAEWHREHYFAARSAYFGGRTEVGRMHAPSVERYDIHSAYPAALTNVPIPLGDPRLYSWADAQREFDRGAPGVYQITIQVPESIAPPLPVRLKQRVCFPFGRLTGAWARPEIERALEVGCSIIEFHWGLVWDRSDTIAAPYCEKIFALRRKAIADGNPNLGGWLKFMANSFTGKCAQDPEGRDFKFDPENDKFCPAPPCDGLCRPSRCCEHHCTGDCGAWDAIDPRGRLWARPSFRMADCMHVHWAAYLTAATRAELHRQIEHAGDSFAYCDTDSVYALEPLTRGLGSELGQWGHEGTGIDWRAIAPKAYMYTDPNEPDPEKAIKVKCKGLSRLSPEAWIDYAEGRPVVMDRGVEGLLTAARKGGSLFTRRVFSRKSNADKEWCGGRKIETEGRTRAPSIDEAIARSCGG